MGQKSNRVVVALAVTIAVVATCGVARLGAGPRPWANSVRLALRPPLSIPSTPATTTSTAIATASPTIPTTTEGAGSRAAAGSGYRAAPRARVPFPVLQVPAETNIAIPNGTIPTYPNPGSASSGTVGTWYGVPLWLPVIAVRIGWLQVRLPQRPNESTAWVRMSDVTITTTPYFIAVSNSATELVVYKGGQPIMDFPAGLGLPATPTPLGHFFVAIREVHPKPLYGPVVLDTSAHSEAIRSWDGEGDAIIAIHGPITSSGDAAIGATGAHISNGCIRLHNNDLARLAEVLPGTPIEIVP